MSIVNGTIVAPISISDVKKTLGVSDSDVYKLCRSEKINMWSRYKPVRITDTLFPDRNSLWYRGSNNDCGIKPTRATSTDVIPALYNEGWADWSYSRPTGGMGSPLRLADFEKYLHNAIAPIKRFMCPSLVRQNGTFTCSVLVASPVENEEQFKEAGSISLSEIFISGVKLSKWYLGAVVTDTEGTVKFFAAGSKNSVDGSFGYGFPEFSTNTLQLNHDYYIYPFLARNPQVQGGDIVVNEFLTLPDSNRGQFRVVSAAEMEGVSIRLTAKYSYDAGGNKVSVFGTLSVHCSNNPKTFSNNFIQFRFSTSSESSSLLVGEDQRKIPDFTVPGNGGEYTYDYTYYINSSYRNKDYYVYVTLNSAQYKSKVYPLGLSEPM